ncbi:MAG: hypothetical protein ACU4EQ_03340 [Candidatus Nitrosoglobus sp.]
MNPDIAKALATGGTAYLLSRNAGMLLRAAGATLQYNPYAGVLIGTAALASYAGSLILKSL